MTGVPDEVVIDLDAFRAIRDTFEGCLATLSDPLAIDNKVARLAGATVRDQLYSQVQARGARLSLSASRGAAGKQTDERRNAWLRRLVTNARAIARLHGGERAGPEVPLRDFSLPTSRPPVVTGK